MNDAERCKDDSHDHQTVGVGEEKDGTEFVIVWCIDCNFHWDEERSWSLGTESEQ